MAFMLWFKITITFAYTGLTDKFRRARGFFTT